MTIALSDTQMELAKLQRTNLPADPYASYVRSLERDLDDLRPVMPNPCTAVLDIGCGLAGVDLMLWRELGFPLDLHLVDVDRIDANPRYGYRTVEDCAAYSSWAETLAFLTANGVPESAIHLYDAKPAEVTCGPVDLALSLISCGFHYPVETYLTLVLKVLRPGGVFVLDVRRHSGQERQLDLAFDEVTLLRSEEKAERLACRKGGA